MAISDWFDRFRGANSAPTTQNTNAYFDAINEMQNKAFAEKGLNSQDLAYIDPPDNDFSFSYVTGNGYVSRPMLTSTGDITTVL